VTPEDIDVDYLFWVCESNEKNILRRCMKNGTTVESIDSKALLEFEIPIAPLEEQSIIVDRVVKLIDQEQMANQAAESALTTIDTLKKSILARAFRGELGTNDPTEPSAKELLQEILAS
ncbi:MAG: restriction endonuclease subunit S, partial [Selenomonas sp.]|nr:restriction endonuclease subunit S [Selenomonas sp.]